MAKQKDRKNCVRATAYIWEIRKEAELIWKRQHHHGREQRHMGKVYK